MVGPEPPPTVSNVAIKYKVSAQASLLGKPSDVYCSRIISLNLSNFRASVQLRPSNELIITPRPAHNLIHFNSLDHLVNRLQSKGYHGGVHLLIALCEVFQSYCKNNNTDLHGVPSVAMIPPRAPVSRISSTVASQAITLRRFMEFKGNT